MKPLLGNLFQFLSRTVSFLSKATVYTHLDHPCTQKQSLRLNTSGSHSLPPSLNIQEGELVKPNAVSPNSHPSPNLGEGPGVRANRGLSRSITVYHRACSRGRLERSCRESATFSSSPMYVDATRIPREPKSTPLPS